MFLFTRSALPPGHLEEHLADDAGYPLVQDLGHDKVEQPLLLSHKQGFVVVMSCQVIKRVGRPSQHVEAGAHAVRVVPQCVHPVLLGDNQGVGLSLLDEANEEGDCGVLQGDRARHPTVSGGEVEEEVDSKLPQHLVLGPVQLLGEETAELLYPRVGRGREQEVNIGFLQWKQ